MSAGLTLRYDHEGLICWSVPTTKRWGIFSVRPKNSPAVASGTDISPEAALRGGMAALLLTKSGVSTSCRQRCRRQQKSYRRRSPLATT